jgi:Spy/CpxP family protein refolding chaperone
MVVPPRYALLAVLALGGAARGDARPAAADPNAAADARKERLRDQIFDQMRAERMWKLTDALKLDEATAAKVFPLLSKYDDHERAIGHERGQKFRELRELAEGPSPDAGRIDALVDKLLALRARRQALETEKTAALRKVLRPVQMAKLMLLTPRIEEAFRQRIHEALDAAEPAAGSAERTKR